MIFAMSFNLTSHMSASQSNLMGLQAGDLGWLHQKIAVWEKRAGEAGNHHGCDLNVTPRK